MGVLEDLQANVYAQWRLDRVWESAASNAYAANSGARHLTLDSGSTTKAVRSVADGPGGRAAASFDRTGSTFLFLERDESAAFQLTAPATGCIRFRMTSKPPPDPSPNKVYGIWSLWGTGSTICWGLDYSSDGEDCLRLVVFLTNGQVRIVRWLTPLQAGVWYTAVFGVTATHAFLGVDGATPQTVLLDGTPRSSTAERLRLGHEDSTSQFYFHGDLSDAKWIPGTTCQTEAHYAALHNGGQPLELFTAGQDSYSLAELEVKARIPYARLAGVSGDGMLRGWMADGTYVTNLGGRADFARFNRDGTLVWRTTADTDVGKGLYFPKLDATDAFYANRVKNVVYCVRLSDGVVRWTVPITGTGSAMELGTIGGVPVVFVGSSDPDGRVTALRRDTGAAMPGWPIEFPQHEQALGAGDLDGDGSDELIVNDNAGTVRFLDHDGATLYTFTGTHTHQDRCGIADFLGDGTKQALIVVRTDGAPGSGEGNRIQVRRADGTLCWEHVIPGGSAPAPDWADEGGVKVFYTTEGGDPQLTCLNGADGSVVYTIPLAGLNPNALGQLAHGDIDGDGLVEVFFNDGDDREDDDHDTVGLQVRKLGTGALVQSVPGHGWDLDAECSAQTGSLAGHRYRDVDGGGKDWVYAQFGATVNSGLWDRAFAWVSTAPVPPAVYVPGDWPYARVQPRSALARVDR